MVGRVLSVLLALALAGCVESMTYRPPVAPKNAPAVVGGADWTAPRGHGRVFVTKTMLPVGRAQITVRDVFVGEVRSDQYMVLILPVGTHPVSVSWSLNPFDQRYTQYVRVSDGQDEFVSITTRNVMRPDLPSFAYVTYGEMSEKQMVYLPTEVADKLRAMVPGNP